MYACVILQLYKHSQQYELDTHFQDVSKKAVEKISNHFSSKAFTEARSDSKLTTISGRLLRWFRVSTKNKYSRELIRAQ